MSNFNHLYIREATPASAAKPPAVTPQAIKNALRCSGGLPEFSPYLEGVRRFLQDWNLKTRDEIIDLCQNVKETIYADYDAALGLFGREAVDFFKGLDTGNILWN